MTTHPLNLWYGPHLAGVFVPRAAFAHQLTQHLNTCLSDTTHQFTLQTFGVADLPEPEPNPHVLPDDFNVDLYLFSNADHPTRNGTIAIDGKGDVRLFVPCPSLQITTDATFYLPAYTQVLGTTLHEFEHVWRRGEQRHAKFVDPPEGVDMPRVNYWAWPSSTDPYWDAGKRDWVLDPFGVSQPVGHPLFTREHQNLSWVLANMRPSRGTRAMMRGKRGGAKFSRSFFVLPSAWPVEMRTWIVPAHYEDPWEQVEVKLQTEVGPNAYVVLWLLTDHGHPFMAFHMTAPDGRVARGYVCIFDLEHHAAIHGVDVVPEVRADFATGRVYLPDVVYPEDPMPTPTAWELLGRLFASVMAKRKRQREEERRLDAEHRAEVERGVRRAMPTSREAWEVKCNACEGEQS